jgi:hypothetical protein
MWFPAAWLAIGFAIKWSKEAVSFIIDRINKWSEKMFDVFYVSMSFALVISSFTYMNLTTWQAVIVFLFWSFVGLMMKVK